MERGQLTLFDCRKVVSGKSWVCFDEVDILALRAVLLQPSSSKHLLLNSLRKLDCYKLVRPTPCPPRAVCAPSPPPQPTAPAATRRRPALSRSSAAAPQLARPLAPPCRMPAT